MDNNGQQNPQGNQNPQGSLPSLDAVIDATLGIGGTPAGTEPVTPPAGTEGNPPVEGGQQQAQGQQAQGQQQAQPPANNSPIEEDNITSLLSADDSTLSEEDRTLKNTLLTTFGATNVDANGNLINEQGQVVLSKDSLDKYIDTGEVLLDAQGNQIDETGKIIKPASEVNTANTIIELSKNAIEQELGFTLLDSEGKPKSYSNSVEGSTELLKDVATNATVNAVTAFLNSNPELKDIYFHLANGGKLDDYTASNIDYTAVDVTTLDRTGKLNYIKQSFEQQGLKNAGSLIKTLEQSSDEALTQAAADAIITLKQVSEDAKAEREREYQLNQQKEAQALEEYWNNVNSVITNGKLKDINIPNAEKEDFFKYLAVPINSKGESQEMIDAEKEDNEDRLLLSYLRFKKFNLNDLVNLKAKTNRLEQLRSRVGIPNPKIENAQARTNGGQQGSPNSFPTLDQITNIN